MQETDKILSSNLINIVKTSIEHLIEEIERIPLENTLRNEN